MTLPETVEMKIPVGDHQLLGDLSVPANAHGLVLFAHGSGSSRLSPRNRYVAGMLQHSGVATLLFDLLTRREEYDDSFDGRLRFDIDLLAQRLAGVTRWLIEHHQTRGLELGYFGSSTGAAAALVAAAELDDAVQAVVSRGGRPDLAGNALERVSAPTLLIVGGEDLVVIELNRRAFIALHAEKDLKVIPGASHLFEEPGALTDVAGLAADWFRKHLHPSPRSVP